MLTYDTLKDRPREFLAATSLTVEEFANLLPAFQAAYTHHYPPHLTQTGQSRQRRGGGGLPGTLAHPAAKLLFILVYHKTNPLQTMHGLQFGLRQPQTNYWIRRLLPVLQEALQTLGHAPERDARQVAGSPLLVDSAPELAIDGTERRRQRPRAPSRQNAHYSGKKKTHTDKNIVLVQEQSRKVVYLGPTVPGKTHDKKAADDAPISYPAHATLDKDSGFQGYEPAGVHTCQPKKKPRGGELSVAEQVLNVVFASARVVVENVLAGVKRCRIVKEALRLTRAGISDRVMEIACGLHNLRMSFRHPEPACDLHRLLSSA
jgi:DDE superfamily endonuclease/Helix-turn-helix of DDE superfamily endonuclease